MERLEIKVLVACFLLDTKLGELVSMVSRVLVGFLGLAACGGGVRLSATPHPSPP